MLAPANLTKQMQVPSCLLSRYMAKSSGVGWSPVFCKQRGWLCPSHVSFTALLCNFHFWGSSGPRHMGDNWAGWWCRAGVGLTEPKAWNKNRSQKLQSDTLMPNVRTPKYIIVLISQIATTGPFVITISDFIAISASRKHHETSWKEKSHGYSISQCGK